MADKLIGRLYIKNDDKLYKVATMKAGKDGSLYIGTPLGPKYKGHGIDGNKFTYHPDGNSWMTSELRFEDFGASVPDDVLRQLEGWKASGLGMANKKLYSKKFDVNIPLDKIRDSIELQYGISYRDIKSLKHHELFEAVSAVKEGSSVVIDIAPYTHLTLRFFLLGEDASKPSGEQYGFVETFYFKHPSVDNLCIRVSTIDRWAGAEAKSS